MLISVCMPCPLAHISRFLNPDFSMRLASSRTLPRRGNGDQNNREFCPWSLSLDKQDCLRILRCSAGADPRAEPGLLRTWQGADMSEFLTSKDGTRIAYERAGQGPVVILVAGAMQFRGFDPTTVHMAGLLAEKGFTAVNYDRRGRGVSTDATSFTLQDEIDDLAALIAVSGGALNRGEANGGEAALFGSSSGGAICLAAAAAGLPITKLALWEVPLGAENGTDGAEFFAGLRERVKKGDRAGTIEFYMKDMPPEWLEGARNSPGWPIML